MDFIDDCLINKYLYEKMNIKQKRCLAEKKLIAKYESRILEITTRLLQSTESNLITNDVKDSFRQFAKSCIRYYKFIDENEEFQNSLFNKWDHQEEASSIPKIDEETDNEIDIIDNEEEDEEDENNNINNNNNNNKISPDTENNVKNEIRQLTGNNLEWFVEKKPLSIN